MIKLQTIANNSYKLQLNNLYIYFSYETPIAFSYLENVGDMDSPKWLEHITISENVWSQTTGKHLNRIDPDKSKRINNNEFNRLMAQELRQ